MDSVEEVPNLADNGCMAEEETNTGSPGQPDANAATAGASGGLASLARDIDNLMSTPKTPQQPDQPADDGGDQVGLLLKEINELLTHETNALLSSTNNLLGQALETIFDPQALAKKNEKIDKALAQALAKGKAGAPPAASIKAPVTNPAPRFAGISRPMTADLSKTGLKPANASAIASGARAPLPTESGDVPVVKIEEAPPEDGRPLTSKYEEKPAEPEPAPTHEPAPVAEAAPAPAPVEAPKPQPKPAVAPKQQPKPKPEPEPVARAASGEDGQPSLILRIMAIPMRFVPEPAKLVVSAAALTMLFALPVAWVLAHRAASHSGIGPIDFTVAGALEEAEEAEKAHAAAKAADATQEADSHGSKSADKSSSKSSSTSSSASSSASASKSASKSGDAHASHGDSHH